MIAGERRGGPRVKLPEGVSLVDIIRSQTHENIRKSAKAVGVSRDVFELARRLVILRDRQILSEDEEAKVNRAFELIEKEGRYTQARDLARDVIERLWDKGSRNGRWKDSSKTRSEDKLHARFDRAMFTVGEVCSNLDSVQVPDRLSHQQRDGAIASLIESISSLSIMLAKVKKGPKQ